MILSHRAPSSLNLREFVKTHVILTPGALLVGCEPQFVLHFRGIRGIRGLPIIGQHANLPKSSAFEPKWAVLPPLVDGHAVKAPTR